LAQRAQRNQVEQMTMFFVSTWMFTLLVNAKVGGCLAILWVVLRMCYSNVYRNSVGVSGENAPPQLADFNFF